MPAKIVVQNVYSRIAGLVPDELSKKIKERLQYKVLNYEHILEAQNNSKFSTSSFDGTVYLYFPEKGHKFYTGMMSDVLQILDEAKFEYTIEDRRIIPERNLSDMIFTLPEGKKNRPYQNVVVASMIKSTRGIMQAATGAGKTMMVSQMIGSIKTGPFIFFVPSKDLLDQAYGCLSDCLSVPIGRVGDGHFDIQGVNVSTIQTAVKAIKSNDPKFKVADYKFDEEDDWDIDPLDNQKIQAIDKLVREAKGIYIDECHHAASRTCQAIMTACPSAYWRYGGSATPFREDGAEKMIQALFGKVVTRISASWLIRNKYLVKPFIFNVRMSGMHGYFSSYQEIYKNYIVENDDLNQLVAKLTIRMRQFNIPTLILVQQYKHGDLLNKYMPDVPFIKGNMPRKKRRDSIDAMRKGELSCAIATTLADEGLDVERLGCVTVAGGGKSITRVYQRVGRVLRSFEGKEKAIVFVFTHEAKYLQNHGDKVSRMLRQEPEFVVVDTDETRVMDDLNDLLCPGSVGIFG
jgi:superfamily II DNA or RNA helicase